MSSRRGPHPSRGQLKVAEGRVAIEGSMMTFVIRLTRNKVGRITGVIEQVKTGLKVRVESLDAVSRAIGEMIDSAGTDQGQNPSEASRQ